MRGGPPAGAEPPRFAGLPLPPVIARSLPTTGPRPHEAAGARTFVGGPGDAGGEVTNAQAAGEGRHAPPSIETPTSWTPAPRRGGAARRRDPPPSPARGSASD